MISASFGLCLGLSAIMLAVPSVYAEELKFAHVYETSTPYHKWAVWAAKEFNQRTEGRHSIKVYPASSLGKEAAINEGLSLGTVDLIYTGVAFLASAYPPISISDYPYTLMGHEHWKKYRDSALFQELAFEYQEASGGNEVVALVYYGARHMTSNQPITQPEHAKNLKIRVPNAPAYVMMPKAVGANPTPMAFSEVYLALQQKVVDAQENPLVTIQAKKFYEVQSNINLTGHIINSLTVVKGSHVDKRLGRADTAVLKQVLWEAADQSTEEVVSKEKELVSWFREQGIQVNTVDKAAFKRKVAILLKKETLWKPSIFQRLQDLNR